MLSVRFTLLEVVVSLLMLAIVLPLTLRAFQLAGNLHQANQMHQLAASLADQHMQEWLITESWNEAESNGDFGDAYPDCTWTLAISDWEYEDQTMKQLDLTVLVTSDRRKEEFLLTTLVPELTEETDE